MPSSAATVDLPALLRSLSFGADDLCDARAAVRTNRDARRAAEETVSRIPEGAGGEDALRRATALHLLARSEEAAAALAGAPDTPSAALVRGRTALENGDPAAAAAAFATLVGSPAGGRTLLVDLATAAALSGDTGLAHKAASRLPDGPDALYAEGIALESDGEYAEALKKYEAALKADPNHARSLFRIAHRLDTEGKDERAAEYYRRLVSLQPTFVNALLNFALLLEDLGRFPEAETCYRRVLAADPRHPRARAGLRDALASQTMFFDEDSERREDRRAQILRTPISEFELSVRSRNCLSKMNIETLGDLVRKTETELLAYKNFGETSLQEIKDILAQKGLRLGMTPEDEAPLQTATRAEAEAQLEALFGGGDEDDDGEGDGEGEADAEAVSSSGPVSLAGRDPREVPIEDLELSIRARRCMETLEIRTVGELMDRSEGELLASKNFGQTSLNEVKRKLDSLGLSLRRK
jgi:DNA-directed RNA polymerase subunit alpha